MQRSDHSAFLTGSPFSRLALLALYVSGAALALGCTPKIGDECTVSTNCSVSGDRLCDITQPNGYCTVFNCEPDTCPEDSECINFGTSSPVDSCTPSQGISPYQRSFCMASCSSDADCRGGYACLYAKDIGAVLAENSRSGPVCAVKPKTQPTLVTYPDGHQSNEVCLGSSVGGAAGAPSAAAGSGAASGDAGASGEGGAGG